jgi:hypothetical protein
LVLLAYSESPARMKRDYEKTMSQENVELVRSICAAWDCGDCGAVDWAHPDIEFVVVEGP